MSDIKDETGETWREEILRDVTCLPEIGCVPSTMVVLGDEARPILSSPQQKYVWIAVAELGKGRVMVLGHSGYIGKINTATGHEDPEIKQFNENTKLWLTKNKGANISEIKSLKNLTIASLSNTKIVICTNVNNSSIPDDHILEFIEKGGALLHAMCAWGWLQCNKTLSLHDLPLYSILDQIGIAYTSGYFRIPKTGLKISCSKASESQHVIHALDHTHLHNCCQTLSQMNDIPIKTLHGVMKRSGHKLHCIIAEKGNECIPSEKHPVSSTVGKSIMFLHDVLTKTGNGNRKMPGIDLFPGDFDYDPPVISGQVTIESSIDACHPTGLYARAGEEIRIEIVSQISVDQGWEVQVGSHTDHLHTSSAMKRWPIIIDRVKITSSEVRMKTPFGGLLYIYSPKAKANITLRVHNVIDSPLFDLTKPDTIKNWEKGRLAPGLWADICGHHVVFTLPSKSIRDIDDPTSVLETWDRVVRAHNHLRGSEANAHRREWIVTDVQPCGGYMHSGYPIVTHLDVADPANALFILNNENLLNKGNWGMFHELGHNMQKPVWTFRGTGEVTCNIFTLHAMDIICNKPTWIHPWLDKQLVKAKKYIHDSSDFCKWQCDPGVALFVYAQIIHQFGWSVYKKTFRHYEYHAKTAELKSDEDKIDFWFHTVSKFAEYNLSPLSDLWNIPLSCSCREKLSIFTPFLPDDEITQAVPEKIEILKKRYPGVIREIRKPHDHFEDLNCCPRKWTAVINKMYP